MRPELSMQYIVSVAGGIIPQDQKEVLEVSVVLSIILTVGVMVVTVGAANAAIILFDRGDKMQAFVSGLMLSSIFYYGSQRTIVGEVWPGSMFYTVLSIGFFIVMIGVFAVLWRWWHVEGSDFIEMIPILVLTLLTFGTMMMVACGIAGFVGDFFGSVVKTIPILMLIGSIGWYLYDLFMFWLEYGKGRERR